MAGIPWIAQTVFLILVKFAIICLSNKHRFLKHQFLEQSNYFDGPVITNLYNVPFQTRTQIHPKCQALNYL